jgi:hypothetical protein
MATPNWWCVILTDVKKQPGDVSYEEFQKLYLPIYGNEILEMPSLALPSRVREAILEKVKNLSNSYEVLKQCEKFLNVCDMVDIVNLHDTWVQKHSPGKNI